MKDCAQILIFAIFASYFLLKVHLFNGIFFLLLMRNNNIYFAVFVANFILNMRSKFAAKNKIMFSFFKL